MAINTITSFLGIGKETTFGTAVAATNYLELLDDSLVLKAGQIVKPTLRSASPLRAVKAKKSVEGSFKVPVAYAGIELLLKSALGTVATSTSGTIYSHNFTLQDTLAIPLTLRMKRGEVLANEYVYAGCKLPKLSFSIQPEAQLELTCDVLGQDESSIGTNSTPTYTSVPYIAWDHLTVCTVGGTTVNAQMFELTLENPFQGDTHKLGSLLRQDPGRSAARKVTGKIEIEFTSTTHYNYFKNNTENAMVVTFDGGIVSGSDHYILTFNLPNVIWQGDTPTVGSSPGPFKQIMNFEARATSEGNELDITVKNATSSVP